MAIRKRGKPEAGSPIHMHRPQHRPGMRESYSTTGDYMVDVLCQTGGFHIFITHDQPGSVTCPKCRAIMDGKPKQLDHSLDHLIYDDKGHQTPRIS